MHYPNEPSSLPECKTALPPVSELDGMNLQHRIASPVTRLGRWWLVYSLVLASGTALCVHLLVGSWAAIERHFEQFGLEFGYVLALASAWAVLGWITRKVKRTQSVESYRLAYLPLIGCVALALGRLVYSPWGTVVFGLAVVYVTWLAYRISHHYAAWMAANPRIDPNAARPYREFARERGTGQQPLQLPVPLETGWGLVLVAYATSVAVQVAGAASPFGPGLAVLSFVVVLVVACVALAVRTTNDRVGLVLGFRLAYRAVFSFLFYNRIACSAPGTFQSPSGSAERRGWQFTRGVMALGVALPAVTAFFVWVPFSQNEATIPVRVVNYDGDKHDRLFAGDRDSTGYLPSMVSENRYLPGEVVLRREERLIYDHLTTPEEKAAYLHRIRYDRHAGLIPNEPLSSASATAPMIRDVRSPAPTDDYAGRVTTAVLAGLCGKQALPVWVFIAALVTAFAAPVVLVLLVTAVVGWPLFARFYRDLESPDATLFDPSVSPYERATDALRTSDHQVASRKPEEGIIREKDHLYLGVTEKGEAPVLMPLSMINAHLQVVGMSGGGKTALFIAPRTDEIIRRGTHSVFVIDLKGEPLLFNTARLAAENAGLRFRYFTNLKVPTFAFNPFTQRHLGRMTAEQRLQMLVRGMGLVYGQGFGQSYFGAANARMLRKLLKRYPDARSFARLMTHAENEESYQGLTNKDKQDGGHMVSVLQVLAGVPALNVAPGDHHPEDVFANAIDLSDLLGGEPQVVYFYLKSDVDEDACRHMARMGMFTMLTAAGLRTPEQKNPVVLVADEYQQVAGNQVKIVLAQARSRGLHCLISHQSMSDLKTPDGDFTKAVRDNTNARIIFSSGDPDTLDEMVKLSGIETRQRAKWPVLVDDFLLGNTGPGASATGEILTDTAQEPRLTREHVQHMSAEQTLGFVQLKKNIGYSWFGSAGFIARFRFPITAEEFKDRNQEVWPGGPGTFIPDFSDPPPTAGTKSNLPTGPTCNSQTGRQSRQQSGRTNPQRQPETTTQPTAQTDQAAPAEPTDPGSHLDRLAAEPTVVPGQSAAKPKRGKPNKPKRTEPQDQPQKPAENGQ